MEQVIYIKNRQNVKMAVKLNVSPERKKCAFLEHGLGARKEYPHMKVLEEYFANNGYNVVNIDATNSLNESGQTKDGITFKGHYEDLEDVIEWAKTQDFYKEPFALAGQSLGAASCLRYAGEFPNKVNTLIIAACPFIDGYNLVYADPMMKEIEKNGFYDKVSKSTGRTLHITKAFNEDLKRQDLTPYIVDVVAHTFIIQGMLDSEFIKENSQKIWDMLNCKKELTSLPGVPHDLANNARDRKRV